MNKLLLLLIPLALLGTSCKESMQQFSDSLRMDYPLASGEHIVLDLYSNRDENDNLTYHEQLEIWYSPYRGARIDFYSFDESGQPFLAHRSFNDLTTGQLYTEVTAEQIFNRQYIVEDTEAPTEIKPYIDELLGVPAPTTTSMVSVLLNDVLEPDSSLLSQHSADYTFTQRTTDDTGYEVIKEFTVDHVTNKIKQVDERSGGMDRPYSRIVVNKRENISFDAVFFTLAGWRKSLSDPNLPLESELY